MKNFNKTISHIFSAVILGTILLSSVSVFAQSNSFYQPLQLQSGATNNTVPASSNANTGVSPSYNTSLQLQQSSPANTSLPSYTAPNDVTLPLKLTTQVSDAGYVSSPKNFKELVTNIIISGILSPIVYLLIGLAVVVFVYGVFKFVKAEGDDKQAGREFIIWGIIGIFVMVSVWGLVNILESTFNLQNTGFSIPKV